MKIQLWRTSAYSYGDSLLGSFAVTLQVPLDKCQSAVKLTELVEKEVSQKVDSLASVATRKSVWPEDRGSMSKTRPLHHMVIYATTCLKRYLGKLNSPHKSMAPTSQILEIEEPERCESWQSENFKISVPSVTQAGSEILDKWSSETPDIEEKADDSLQPLSNPLDAHYAVSENCQHYLVMLILTEHKALIGVN